MALEPWSWQQEAACNKLSIDDLFPDHLENPQLGVHVRRIAVQYCARCPVWRQCSEMPDKGEGGIYAGKIFGRSLRGRGGPPRGSHSNVTMFPLKARKAFHK